MSFKPTFGADNGDGFSGGDIKSSGPGYIKTGGLGSVTAPGSPRYDWTRGIGIAGLRGQNIPAQQLIVAAADERIVNEQAAEQVSLIPQSVRSDNGRAGEMLRHDPLGVPSSNSPSDVARAPAQFLGRPTQIDPALAGAAILLIGLVLLTRGNS